MRAQNPREIAARILRERETGADFVENLLEAGLSRAKLPPADAGLCHELTYGITRWQRTLNWLIAKKTKGREQRTALQILLQLGLYQIFWLDRIPNHAAVNETVELAKKTGFTGQAGFINATLRGYLREFDETKKLLAEIKTSEPALGHSHPDWLFEKWKNRWGIEKTVELMAWNNTPPKNFARINTLKTDAAKLIEVWREEKVEFDFVNRDWLDENLIFEFKSHPPLATLKSFRDGYFYVQDPSTLLAVRELAPQPGEAVLDLCAAPGGKTTFIAQLMNNQGRITAIDLSTERLKLVTENCGRLGVSCVETIPTSSFSPLASHFDKILIDAPCSNTGVMRRRVDLRWRIQPQEIERLRKTQLELLNIAAPQLKPGGIMIYSTCSLEPEENSEVVKKFLGEHPEFQLGHERELLPFADKTDGAYVAKLRRAAS